MVRLPRVVRRGAKNLRKGVASYAKPFERKLQTRSRERAVARELRELRAAGGPVSGPDFLIIGAPKCATSWLRAALTRDPRIVMVQEEVEFFTKRLHRPLEWYLGLFAEHSAALDPTNLAYRRPFAECRIGEKSASYCALPPRRIALLHQLRPDARLILMIRDPVRRHWAHAKRFFSKQYFGKKGLDLSVIGEKEILGFCDRVRHFGEYSRMLENWTAVFDRSQLLVLVQEEVFQDPQKAYGQAIEHIGLPVGEPEAALLQDFMEIRKNRGPDVPMPEAVRVHLDEMFAPEYARLEAVLGRPLPPLWGVEASRQNAAE